MDKRIFIIDKAIEGYVVFLRFGYSYLNQHSFSAISKDDLEYKMLQVQKCTCRFCAAV
jgi:hypothetical protein